MKCVSPWMKYLSTAAPAARGRTGQSRRRSARRARPPSRAVGHLDAEGAVGHDAEIPHRLALPGGIAGHQADEALLIGNAQRLGELIADGKDGGLALVAFARRAGADPEAVTIGAKG